MDALDAAWKVAEAGKEFVRFGGGFPYGLGEVPNQEPVYLLNGFRVSARAKSTGNCGRPAARQRLGR